MFGLDIWVHKKTLHVSIIIFYKGNDNVPTTKISFLTFLFFLWFWAKLHWENNCDRGDGTQLLFYGKVLINQQQYADLPSSHRILLRFAVDNLLQIVLNAAQSYFHDARALAGSWSFSLNLYAKCLQLSSTHSPIQIIHLRYSTHFHRHRSIKSSTSACRLQASVKEWVSLRSSVWCWCRTPPVQSNRFLTNKYSTVSSLRYYMYIYALRKLLFSTYNATFQTFLTHSIASIGHHTGPHWPSTLLHEAMQPLLALIIWTSFRAEGFLPVIWEEIL